MGEARDAPLPYTFARRQCYRTLAPDGTYAYRRESGALCSIERRVGRGEEPKATGNKLCCQASLAA
jgi:hypothetical protein